MKFLHIILNKFRRAYAKPLSGMAFVLLLLLCNACRKQELDPGNPATVQVFNALNDGTHVYTIFSEQRPSIFRRSGQLYNKEFMNWYLPPTQSSPQPVSLYSIPDTMEKDQPMLRADLEFEQGAIYSMFIHGSRSSAKYTWQKERIPLLSGADTSTWMRFANFSEDQTISVNLKGQPAGSFVQQLPLHALSGFVQLSVDHTVDKYEFEIRDLHTGELITTYVADIVNTFYYESWYNRSNTLVLTGKQDGEGNLAPTITRMNHR